MLFYHCDLSTTSSVWGASKQCHVCKNILVSIKHVSHTPLQCITQFWVDQECVIVAIKHDCKHSWWHWTKDETQVHVLFEWVFMNFGGGVGNWNQEDGTWRRFFKNCALTHQTLFCRNVHAKCYHLAMSQRFYWSVVSWASNLKYLIMVCQCQ